MRDIEAVLNRAVADYDAASEESAREFFALKVQILIFTYDLASGMLSVGRNRPSGFAAAVALKPLVHSAYEFERHVNRGLVPKILRYAAARGKAIDTAAIKRERAKWRRELATVRSWKQLRDVATGHYGNEIEEQIRLLRTLNQSELLSVVSNLVNYGLFLFKQLPHKSRSDA